MEKPRNVFPSPLIKCGRLLASYALRDPIYLFNLLTAASYKAILFAHSKLGNRSAFWTLVCTMSKGSGIQKLPRQRPSRRAKYC